MLNCGAEQKKINSLHPSGTKVRIDLQMRTYLTFTKQIK
jgi:hypothetical protein